MNFTSNISCIVQFLHLEIGTTTARILVDQFTGIANITGHNYLDIHPRFQKTRNVIP